MLSPNPIAKTASRSEPAPSPAPNRVLIVEDNVDAARLLEILLRTRAHPVSVAHDGRTALRLAREELPAVMLIDIGLPDLSGYELARLIRADETLRSTQLIALTGYGEAAARAMTAASGFDHHLVKPLDRAELERLLQQVAAPVAVPPTAGTFQPAIAVAGKA